MVRSERQREIHGLEPLLPGLRPRRVRVVEVRFAVVREDASRRGGDEEGVVVWGVGGWGVGDGGGGEGRRDGIGCAGGDGRRGGGIGVCDRALGVADADDALQAAGGAQGPLRARAKAGGL